MSEKFEVGYYIRNKINWYVLIDKVPDYYNKSDIDRFKKINTKTIKWLCKLCDKNLLGFIKSDDGFFNEIMKENDILRIRVRSIKLKELNEQGRNN